VSLHRRTLEQTLNHCEQTPTRSVAMREMVKCCNINGNDRVSNLHRCNLWPTLYG